MEFTEITLTNFFRKIGQPAAGARLIDHLRSENLVLVHGGAPDRIVDLGAEASQGDVEQFMREYGKKKS